MMRYYLLVNDDEGTRLAHVGRGQRRNAEGVREDMPAPDHPRCFGPYDSAPPDVGVRIKRAVMERVLARDRTVFALPIEEVIEELPKTGFNRFAHGLTPRKLVEFLADDMKRAPFIADAEQAYAEHQEELTDLHPLDRFMAELNIHEVLKILASGDENRINSLVTKAKEIKTLMGG